MIALPADPGLLAGFLLLATRLLAALQFAPPFTGTGLPVRVRLGLAVGISAAATPVIGFSVEPTLGTLVTGIIYQVVVGAAMGLLIQLVLASVQAAGAMIDVMSGLGAAALYDPFTQAQASPVARLHQLVAVTGLFIIDGHLLVVRGVLRTFEAAPLSGFRVDAIPRLASDGAAHLLLAAAEIAMPVLVALALAEVVLGLASRAAPRLNVMVLGFAAKSMIMIIVLGISLPLALRSISTLIMRSLDWSIRLLGG